MPYTRNTRIKVVNKKHTKEYTAQVEYRYPLTNITVWESFEDDSVLDELKWMFTDGSGISIATKAYNKCVWDENLDNVEGLEWAKAVIDRYHRLLDEKEHKDTVEYVKYPDQETLK